MTHTGGEPPFDSLFSNQQEWLHATMAAIRSLTNAMQNNDDWEQALKQANNDLQRVAIEQARHAARWPLFGPGLGPGAREVDHCRQLQAALQDVLLAASRCSQHLTNTYNLAFARWSTTLTDKMADPDSVMPDTEALLDSWLDCLSNVYDETLLSDAYQADLHALNQALHHARTEALPLLDPWFRQLGLASRKDLAGTQERLHQWRRAQQHELSALRGEIDALRAEVSRLSGPEPDRP